MFRRKSKATAGEADADTATAADAATRTDADADGADASDAPSSGSDDAVPTPRDVDDVDLDDGVERVDLGGVLIEHTPDLELQLQVDNDTHEVQAILLAAEQGAVEVRPFAAPRNGDLWNEIRGEISEDITGRGGQCEEREGPWGTEIFGVVPVQVSESEVVGQPSRIVGVNGSRWMLRATFLGKPAVEPESAEAATWEAALGKIVVRRGKEAMPVGDPLPITLPPQARPVQNGTGED